MTIEWLRESVESSLGSEGEEERGKALVINGIENYLRELNTLGTVMGVERVGKRVRKGGEKERESWREYCYVRVPVDMVE